jgi:hypothetical protein
MRVALALVLLGTVGTAHAACPDGQANCLLHEEGVVLLTSGKFEEAAAKFQASLAAGPTARAALGYAQAIEGEGKIALSYESMLYAKQLSDTEMSTNGQDVGIIGRSERIKYKLGELRAKVGFVQIKLPPNVPPKRVVSVRRKGEGDLADPLLRWVVVAPDHQTLVAFLDDGSKIEVDAQVGAGMQGSVVIPVGLAAIRPGGGPKGPDIVANNGGNQGNGRPIQDLYPHEPPKPADPPPELALGLDLVTMFPNPNNMSSGIGVTALFEKRLGDKLGLSGRMALIEHPETTFVGTQDRVFSGRELMATIGLRTASKGSFYAFAEAGVIVYLEHGQVMAPPGPGVDEEITSGYPTLMAGGATRIGRVHLQAGAVWAIEIGDVSTMPVRFMASLGIDLVKR